MIGTMSYHSPQSEFFVRSLRRRLQSLTPERSNSDMSFEEHGLPDPEQPIGLLAALSCEDDKDRVRRIIGRGLKVDESKMANGEDVLSSFPTNRFLNGETHNAKCQPVFERVSNLDTSSSPKGLLDQDDKVGDFFDSDLFFDFDIESPDVLENGEPQISTEKYETRTENSQETVNGHSSSSNSPTILENSHSPNTAYGSTSSGLYSDTDTRASTSQEESDPPTLETIESHSFNPKDWIKNQSPRQLDEISVTSTPIISPIKDENPFEDVKSNNSSVPETTSDTEGCFKATSYSNETDTVTICIGSTEKSVAQSKLQALLDQLEKGGEFGRPGIPSKRRSSKDSCASDSVVIESKSKSPSFERWLSSLEMTDFEKDTVFRSSPKPKETSNEARPVRQGSAEDIPKLANDEKKENYRRCSSLRSGKTPPGTPGKRKIVRFADVFGLEIADVKTFLDEVPKVPESAFRDLKDADLIDVESDTGLDLIFSVQPPIGPPAISNYTTATTPTMAPLFNQPSSSSEFFNILRDRKVCLENAYMSDASNIKGIVRVVNLDYNKKVFVKCTLNDWKTTDDISATYIIGSCDGFSDKFSFTIDYSPISCIIGRRLEFCIRYECASNDYWDNNFGKNYIFQCFGPSPSMIKGVSGSVPISSPSPRLSIQNTLSQSPGGFNEDPWHLYI